MYPFRLNLRKLSQIQTLLLELKSLQDEGVKLVIKLQPAAQFCGHLLISIRVRIRQWNILGVKMLKDVGKPAGHEGLHHGQGEVPLLDDPHHTVVQLHIGLRSL